MCTIDRLGNCIALSVLDKPRPGKEYIGWDILLKERVQRAHHFNRVGRKYMYRRSSSLRFIAWVLIYCCILEKLLPESGRRQSVSRGGWRFDILIKIVLFFSIQNPQLRSTSSITTHSSNLTTREATRG